jgi:hypothetical protein
MWVGVCSESQFKMGIPCVDSLGVLPPSVERSQYSPALHRRMLVHPNTLTLSPKDEPEQPRLLEKTPCRFTFCELFAGTGTTFCLKVPVPLLPLLLS